MKLRTSRLLTTSFGPASLIATLPMILHGLKQTRESYAIFVRSINRSSNLAAAP
jgi:hypothetical protein